MDDVLNSFTTGGFIQVDGDNFITVVYQNEVLSTSAEELINIADFTVPIVLNNQTTPTPFPAEFDIDVLHLLSGTLRIRFESNDPGDVEVVLTFPNVNDPTTSQPFTHTVNVQNTNGTVPLVVEETVDISGLEFDFSSGNFTINHTATVVATGLPTVLTDFFLDFQTLKHTYIEGYFGSGTFNLPTQTVTLDIFNSWESGVFSFEEPNIGLTFKNSFGLPIRVNVDTLEAMTRLAGDMDIIVTGYPNGVDLNYPTLSEVGQTKDKTVVVTANNSNFNQVLSQGPFGLSANFAAQANPTMNTAIKTDDFRTRDFASPQKPTSVTDVTYAARMDARVLLRFYGFACGFTTRCSRFAGYLFALRRFHLFQLTSKFRNLK